MNNSFFKFSGILFFVLLLLVSCDDEKVSTASFSLNISGLEDLGSDYAYEGWVIVNGNPVSTGIFTVDQNGQMSSNNFMVNVEDLDNASTFVLTIEPSPDADPGPSDVHILAGDFANNTASLSIDHPAAIGDDFQTLAGEYILATPTNGSNTNENSGIWWLDLSSGSPEIGLTLPMLPDAWQYEGWVVISGVPVTTGTFRTNMGVDDADPYSGEMDGPPFPGEDFLTNAPMNLSFPVDLSGGTAVISIEPVPDNSPNPFLLKPLIGQIPTNAVDHFNYDMDQNLSFPTGTVTR